MGTFTNTEYPDEMQQNEIFHLGLPCKVKKDIFENYNLTPLDIYSIQRVKIHVIPNIS